MINQADSTATYHIMVPSYFTVQLNTKNVQNILQFILAADWNEACH